MEINPKNWSDLDKNIEMIFNKKAFYDFVLILIEYSIRSSNLELISRKNSKFNL